MKINAEPIADLPESEIDQLFDETAAPPGKPPSGPPPPDTKAEDIALTEEDDIPIETDEHLIEPTPRPGIVRLPRENPPTMNPPIMPRDKIFTDNPIIGPRDPFGG